MAGSVPSQPSRLSYGEAIIMCLISGVLSFGAAAALSLVLDQRQRAAAAQSVPEFGMVDTRRLLSSFIADQASKGIEGDALRDATADWTRAYNEIIWQIHSESGLVILSSDSVAAGGSDLTEVIADALR